MAASGKTGTCLKDCLPYATFQFGAVKFPSGVNDSDTLWFQPVAVRKGDLRLMSLQLTN